MCAAFGIVNSSVFISNTLKHSWFDWIYFISKIEKKNRKTEKEIEKLKWKLYTLDKEQWISANACEKRSYFEENLNVTLKSTVSVYTDTDTDTDKETDTHKDRVTEKDIHSMASKCR